MELYHLKDSFKVTVNCAPTARKLLRQHDIRTIATCAPEFWHFILILARSAIFYHSNTRETKIKIVHYCLIYKYSEGLPMNYRIPYINIKGNSIKSNTI